MNRVLIRAALAMALVAGLGVVYLYTPSQTRGAPALVEDLFAPGDPTAFNPAWSRMCFGNPGLFDVPSHFPLGHLRTVLRDQNPAEMASRLVSPRFVVPTQHVFAVLYRKGEAQAYVFSESELIAFNEDDCAPIKDLCIERSGPGQSPVIKRCAKAAE